MSTKATNSSSNPELKSMTVIKVLANPSLSKEAEVFYKKVKKIETLKKSNDDLKNRLESIRIQVLSVMSPLTDKIRDLKFSNLEILDQHMKANELKAKEKKKLKSLIVELSAQFIEEFNDDRGKQFYNAYSDMGFDEQQDQMLDDFESFMKGIFDDFGDDLDDEFNTHFNSQYKKKPKEESQQQFKFKDEQKNTFGEDFDKNLRRNKKPGKKSKAEIQKEKVELESKSLYRNLMKKLHPDLEQDEFKRLEKTEISQKITSAYNENNIYELLKLRSEHLDESLSNEELKIYDSELNQKIKELQHERVLIQKGNEGFFDYFYQKSDASIKRIVNQDKKKLQLWINEETELQQIYSDTSLLKKLLMGTL